MATRDVAGQTWPWGPAKTVASITNAVPNPERTGKGKASLELDP